MPLILVKMLEGRSPDKIARFIEAVTDAAFLTLDAPRETVRVVVEEVPKTHWGSGGKTMSVLRPDSPPPHGGS